MFECCGGFVSGEDLSVDGGWLYSGRGGGDLFSARFTVVISCMLDLLLSFPPESCLMKYF